MPPETVSMPDEEAIRGLLGDEGLPEDDDLSHHDSDEPDWDFN